MASRSVNVRVTNQNRDFNLFRKEDTLDHGVYTTRPPDIIGDFGEWASESDGFATGTEGHIVFDIHDLDDVVIGELRLHWDNPFVGSNSYHESVAPQATVPGDSSTFTTWHSGGGGDNATVDFFITRGLVVVHTDPDTGEVTATVEQAGTAQPSAPAQPAGAPGGSQFAAVFEQTGGPAFQARHNITADQYQQTFDELVPQGFRPTVVNGYQVGGEARFAAVFEQTGGPAFQARHNITGDQYQQTFDELVPQGFRPTVVCGYEVAGVPHFAAVFEQTGGPAFQARHNITADQYQQTFDELVPQGFRPTVVNGYQVGGEARFAAVFEQTGGPAFQARHNITADQYQQTFDELVPQGFRPTVVCGYVVGGEARFAAVFEQTAGTAFQARHNITGDQYQQTFDELVGQGFRPTVISGY